MAEFKVRTEYTYTRTFTVTVPDDVSDEWKLERVRTAAATQALEEITSRKNGHTIKATIDGHFGSAGFIQFAGHINDSDVAALREPKPDHGGDNKVTAQALAEQARADAARVMKEGTARAKDDLPKPNAFCDGHIYADDELGRARPPGGSESQQSEGSSESAGGDATPSDS